MYIPGLLAREMITGYEVQVFLSIAWKMTLAAIMTKRARTWCGAERSWPVSRSPLEHKDGSEYGKDARIDEMVTRRMRQRKRGFWDGPCLGFKSSEKRDIDVEIGVLVPGYGFTEAPVNSKRVVFYPQQ